MSTVGFGDISATNNVERACAILAMFLGCGFYGVLVAKISNALLEYDALRRKTNERLDQITAYVSRKRFVPSTQREIIRYYRRYLKASAHLDETQIIRELSYDIRTKIVSHLVPEEIIRNPFFIGLSANLVDLVQVPPISCNQQNKN